MRIRGIGCSMPDRVVKNDEVLRLIKKYSQPLMNNGQMESILARVKTLFRLSGTQERRWRSDGERAYDFGKRAAEIALERAELKPDDIDLLIYVGVGRGWVEPGMGTFFQNELGMKNATTFDLLDACMSWLRAIHVAYNFLKNGVYKNIMILNVEFNKGYEKWEIQSVDKLAYRFAQCTIGESATATILSNGDVEVEPYFVFKTDPSLHDLCKIPLESIDSYNNKERCPELDPMVFFAYSADLFKAAKKMIPKLFKKSAELKKRKCDIAFVHSASATLIDKLAKHLHKEDVVVNLYSKFGNTVSASIPTAMCWALENDRLKRGMHMMLVMGSAGFSAGVCHMVY